MNRRDSYADLDKWRTTCAQQKRRYYGSTAFAKNHHQPWTTAEIEAIMARELTDRELSRLLGRSVGAIQTMRNRIKKGGGRQWKKSLKDQQTVISGAGL